MGKENEIATAPYNFVSLPKTVLASPMDGNAVTDEERTLNYRTHVLEKGRLSGRIELTIETKTPVFIGTGVGTAEDKDLELFFSPMGVPMIPGSSLRGMIKNLFKIVTCGAMRAGEDYHNRVFYYRTLADRNKRMGELYRNEMSVQNDRRDIAEPQAAAGYLVQITGDQGYYICPTGKPAEIIPYGSNRQVENTVIWGEPGSGEADCHTGRMSGKRTYTRHCNPDWMQRIPVPVQVVKTYREDRDRKGVDLLTSCRLLDADARVFTGQDDIQSVVPCFYKMEKGEVKHFGFGRFYRLAYHMSVSDHVIDMDVPVVDYADALFGRKELWASRLSFTDALPEEEPQMDAPDYPKILSSPKPTAVQLYLEQKHGADRLAHWDSEKVSIRGYKLYWHQKNSADWHGEKPKDGDERRKIQPVKKGTKFFANIRFERLSEDELGALLKTLRINGDHLCCKIGKGKSLGLGSIEITSSLVLMDMKESYLNAFDGVGGWNRAESTADNAKIQNLITAFDNYVKDREINYDKSIEELRHMLDWSKTEIHGWKEEIEQMSIQDERKPFQKRWILPTALEVGKKRP